MIGEIRKTFIPYYDLAQGRMNMKSRPSLIIAQADADDFVVLPVSRITRRWNRDPVFDIEIDPALYPQLNLNAVSFVRTHKQTVVYRADIGDRIGDMKSIYPELYLRVLAAREQFSSEITSQAIL